MMKFALLLPLLVLVACSGAEDPAEQSIAPGTCLQLEVAIDGGFKVDGASCPADHLGSALTRALEAGDRSAVVDVTCGDGVTMESIRVLHQVMLDHGLHRIQYLREPESAIPLMLANAQMTAHLDALPDEERCIVAVAAGGEATLAGGDFDREAVRRTLETNHDVVFIVAVSTEVSYLDFARVLGEVTEAGAERVTVQIIAS